MAKSKIVWVLQNPFDESDIDVLFKKPYYRHATFEDEKTGKYTTVYWEPHILLPIDLE